jgi:hypothetical protein
MADNPKGERGTHGEDPIEGLYRRESSRARTVQALLHSLHIYILHACDTNDECLLDNPQISNSPSNLSFGLDQEATTVSATNTIRYQIT